MTTVPLCSKCKEPIGEGSTLLGGNVYHPHCVLRTSVTPPPLTEARVREIVRDELQLAGILNR